jgi:hypothetical protein
LARDREQADAVTTGFGFLVSITPDQTVLRIGEKPLLDELKAECKEVVQTGISVDPDADLVFLVRVCFQNLICKGHFRILQSRS